MISTNFFSCAKSIVAGKMEFENHKIIKKTEIDIQLKKTCIKKAK